MATNRIGAPLSAARPAAGIASAGGAVGGDDDHLCGGSRRRRSVSSELLRLAAAVGAGRAGRAAWRAQIARRERPPTVPIANHLRAAERGGARRVHRFERLRRSPRAGFAFAVEDRRAGRRARERREAASAAGQSCSLTSTTACGRVAAVRPG